MQFIQISINDIPFRNLNKEYFLLINLHFGFSGIMEIELAYTKTRPHLLSFIENLGQKALRHHLGRRQTTLFLPLSITIPLTNVIVG